jgi:hypothetical protein
VEMPAAVALNSIAINASRVGVMWLERAIVSGPETGHAEAALGF